MQPLTLGTFQQLTPSAVDFEEEDKASPLQRSRRERKNEISYRENNSEKSDFVRHLITQEISSRFTLTIEVISA
jgi:hypothetical protein